MQSLIPHLVIWAVLATVVILLAIYRRRVDLKADDMLHVAAGEEREASAQVVVSKKLVKIDLWGKILTVIVVVYGLALAGWYIYSQFADSSIKM